MKTSIILSAFFLTFTSVSAKAECPIGIKTDKEFPGLTDSTPYQPKLYKATQRALKHALKEIDYAQTKDNTTKMGFVITRGHDVVSASNSSRTDFDGTVHHKNWTHDDFYADVKLYAQGNLLAQKEVLIGHVDAPQEFNGTFYINQYDLTQLTETLEKMLPECK